MNITLAGGVDDFDEAHSVIHKKLFSVGILDCWVIRLTGIELGEIQRYEMWHTSANGRVNVSEGVYQTR
jgi:hypothetical protein